MCKSNSTCPLGNKLNDAICSGGGRKKSEWLDKPYGVSHSNHDDLPPVELDSNSLKCPVGSHDVLANSCQRHVSVKQCYIVRPKLFTFWLENALQTEFQIKQLPHLQPHQCLKSHTWNLKRSGTTISGADPLLFSVTLITIHSQPVRFEVT